MKNSTSLFWELARFYLATKDEVFEKPLVGLLDRTMLAADWAGKEEVKLRQESRPSQSSGLGHADRHSSLADDSRPQAPIDLPP